MCEKKADNLGLLPVEEARCCKYTLLSRIIAEQSTVADLRQYLDFIEPFVDGDNGHAGSFSLKLKSWMNSADADRRLKTEYAGLFIMPGGIRPYESVYRGEAPLLMQEPWVDVKRFYHRCGLKLENPSRHPEDHASVELAFMANLIEAGGQVNEEREFFSRHIALWMPGMFRDICKHPKAGFFKDIAEFALLFLEREQVYLGTGSNSSFQLAEQLQGSDQRDEE